jgi:hypothetical protein
VKVAEVPTLGKRLEKIHRSACLVSEGIRSPSSGGV